MKAQDADFHITPEHIAQYLTYLTKKGYKEQTIYVYNRAITDFFAFLDGKPVTRKAAAEWKSKLSEIYPVKKMSEFTTAVNKFAEYYGLGKRICQTKDDTETSEVRCPECGEANVVGNGKSRNGQQRYMCRNEECNKTTFRVKYHSNGCKPEIEDQIIALAADRGIYSIARVLEISPAKVASVLKKHGILANHRRIRV
jgi:transposase-like protein